MEAQTQTQPRRRGRPVGSYGKKKRATLAGPVEAAALPPPIESGSAPGPVEAPKLPGLGLLDGVKNLFQSKAEQAPGPGSVADFGETSSPSSISEGPISPESLRLLGSVPDSIGGTVEENDGAPGEPAEVDPIAALMAQVAFEPQDVQDVLTEFFDWCAERAASDHWKLTERQGRMVGRPLATLLNSMWAKLQLLLPDVLGRWCESTPGAMAFLLAAGLVLGPKVGKQIAISKARRKVVPMVKERAAQARAAAPPAASAPLPPRPQGGGIVFESAA